MYKKRKIESRYVVLIILVLVAVILGGLFYVFHENRNLTIIEKGVKDAGLFIEKIIYTPINFIKDSINEYQEKQRMYNDYKKMKESYKNYESLEAKYKEKEKEMNEMEKLLEINASLSEGTYINTTAISRNIDYWYQNLIIDKGKKDEVKKGFAVINYKGLIGYIDAVSNHNSTVKLLTAEDLNHKISVKIEIGDSYIYGLLTYYDKDKNVFTIEGISENTGVPKDALVTTTGLGNTFPSGLIIGTVADTSLDHFELAKTVYVKPATNFEDLNYLMVVKKDGEV